MVAQTGKPAGPRIVRQTPRDPNVRPFIVIWEVTQACDLACRHCRARAQPNPHPAELAGEEAFRLLEQVAAFGPPPPLFVLTGGDPFKRPDLPELVRYGDSLGLPVSVSPSGTPTLTPENLRRVREAGAVALSLSVDGAGPETHDGFRMVDGVFDWTLSGWEAARELGFKIQVNTTVTPHNLRQLPEILRLVWERRAMTWSLFFLVPVGRGEQLEQLTPRQFEEVLHFLYDADKLVPLKTTEAPHFRRVVLQRHALEQRGIDAGEALGLGETYRFLRDRMRELLPEVEFDSLTRLRRAPLDVNAGRGFVFISHTGFVYPSGFLPETAGNVRDRSLVEIYRESPLFRRLREPDRFHGRCGRCEYRALCGGSRSRAFGATGDPFAEDAWCVYEPGSFPYPDDVAALLEAGARKK